MHATATPPAKPQTPSQPTTRPQNPTPRHTSTGIAGLSLILDAVHAPQPLNRLIPLAKRIPRQTHYRTASILTRQLISSNHSIPHFHQVAPQIHIHQISGRINHDLNPIPAAPPPHSLNPPAELRRRLCPCPRSIHIKTQPPQTLFKAIHHGHTSQSAPSPAHYLPHRSPPHRRVIS